MNSKQQKIIQYSKDEIYTLHECYILLVPIVTESFI
jgi:hypothetical protein